MRIQGDNRHLIKHVLIGTPEIVEFTTRRLDELGFAHLSDWATPLDLDDEPLKIVPDAGDVITLMVRYMRL